MATKSCSDRNGSIFMRKYYKLFIVILTPILLLPLVLVNKYDEADPVPHQRAKCGFVILVMAIYWVSEALPLAVTGIVPLFLLPMMGLVRAPVVAVNYMKDSTVLFIGGLVVALGIEKSFLHQRIALGILNGVGTKPIWLLLGFMLITWFLSMWISNTATTAMMLPMVDAVIQQLDPTKLSKATDEDEEDTGEGSTGKGAPVSEKPPPYEEDGQIALQPVGDQRGGGAVVKVDEEDEFEDENMEREKKTYANFSKVLILAIAYSANVGGTGTLTGTTPNLVMKEEADRYWRTKGYAESPVNFAGWMAYGVPTSLIILILIWLWMLFMTHGCRGNCGSCRRPRKVDDVSGGNSSEEARDAKVKAILRSERDKLGPMKFDQIMILIVFIAMILLWFFRNPEFLTGWAQNFGMEDGNLYVTDSVPAILLAVSFFVLPKEIPTSWEQLRSTGKDSYETLMDWNTFEKKMPWGTVLLVGGGFALAEASTKSGLAAWLGEEFQVFGNMPDWCTVLVLCLLVTIITNVFSNTAMCTLLMPIMAQMAERLDKNPLYLMMPVALSTSYAFMLPVGTPPNAIAFSTGKIAIVDMLRVGSFLNIICVLVIVLANHTWGMAHFKLNEIPWANSTIPGNITMAF